MIMLFTVFASSHSTGSAILASLARMALLVEWEGHVMTCKWNFARRTPENICIIKGENMADRSLHLSSSFLEPGFSAGAGSSPYITMKKKS